MPYSFFLAFTVNSPLFEFVRGIEKSSNYAEAPVIRNCDNFQIFTTKPGF